MGDWVWLLSLVVSLVSLGLAGFAAYIAGQRPAWQQDVTRKMTVIEDEWADVLDRIKRRGDRLSKERGLLMKREEETAPAGVITTKANLWALKRAKEKR